MGFLPVGSIVILGLDQLKNYCLGKEDIMSRSVSMILNDKPKIKLRASFLPN